MAVEEMTFSCPECGMTSHHPTDIQNRYCGFCNRFLDDVGAKRRRRYHELMERSGPTVGQAHHHEHIRIARYLRRRAVQLFRDGARDIADEILYLAGLIEDGCPETTNYGPRSGEDGSET